MATEKIFFAVEVEVEGSVSKIEKLRANFKGLQAEIKSVERARKRGSITAKEANKQLVKLDKELIKSRDAYKKATKAAIDNEKSVSKGAKGFLKAEKSSKKLNDQMAKNQTLSESLGDSFKKLGAALTIGFAIQQAIKLGKQMIEVTREFESSVAELQAITGASAESLEFLSKKAIELSATSTKSSAEILTAFKKIASAKPELLENADALAELTEQAIILSEASGLDLATAAEQLGSALNAMNLPASEAGRVIDVLATAAQLGAREIPFINDALSKFGGVAAQAGVSIEDSAAAIEILGKVIPEASIVGTSLRNVLTIMQIEAQKSGREFKGLSGELELLSPDINDITKLTKIFGKESLLAVQTLIREQDALSELSGKLNETGNAQSQAAINSATLEAAQERLLNVFDNALILIGTQGSGGLADAFTLIADGIAIFTGQVEESEQPFNVLNKLMEFLEITTRLASLPIVALIGFVDALINGFDQANFGIEGLGNAFKDFFDIIDKEEVAEKRSLDSKKRKKQQAKDEAAQRKIDNAELIEGNEEVEKSEDKLDKKRVDSDARRAENARKAAERAESQRQLQLQKELKAQQDAEDKIFTFLLSKEEKEIQALNQKFEALALLDAADKEQKIELERLHQEQLTALVLEHARIKNEAETEIAEEKAAREVEAHIAELEQEHAAFEASKNIQQQKIGIAQDGFGALADLAKEGSKIEKIALLAEKAAAIANIIISVQKEIAANNVAAAIQSAALAAVPGAGVAIAAKAVVKNNIARARGAVGILTVAAQSLAQGGIIEGNSHANGGVSVMGGRAEVEGGEIILTRGVANNPSLLAAANQLNIAGGGQSFLQDGGVLPNNFPTFALPSSQGENLDIIADAISSLNLRIGVDEINAAQSRVAVAESTATV